MIPDELGDAADCDAPTSGPVGEELVRELLVRVRDRIADPARWHGDAASRRGDLGAGGGLNEAGEQVAPTDPTAVRHCVLGAIKLEAGTPQGVWPLPGVAGEAFARIGEAAGWPEGRCWNDDDGYEVTFAAVEAALERLGDQAEQSG